MSRHQQHINDKALANFIHPDTEPEKLRQLLYVTLYGHMNLVDRMMVFEDATNRGIFEEVETPPKPEHRSCVSCKHTQLSIHAFPCNECTVDNNTRVSYDMWELA